MRDLMLMLMTAQASAAIRFARAGSPTARLAPFAGLCMSRAHGIPVARRTQNILA